MKVSFQRLLPPHQRILLLHVACKHQANVNVVNALISAYPEFVKVKAGLKGKLPLHEACRGNLEFSVVNALISVYPESVKVKNNSQTLPLYHACENPRHGACIDTIKVIIKAYPEALMTKQSCRIFGLTALNSLLQYVNWLVWEVCSVN